jgi:hypothetical protein
MIVYFSFLGVDSFRIISLFGDTGLPQAVNHLLCPVTDIAVALDEFKIFRRNFLELNTDYDVLAFAPVSAEKIQF